MVPLGFNYTRSSRRTLRKKGEFTCCVSFQSSHLNVAGHYIALWIHATVLSNRLAEWRKSQSRAFGSGEGVAGGQIGNLVRPPRWRDWNLADPRRDTVIVDAISVVHSIALPYFGRFEDIPALCSVLQNEELPGMIMSRAIEFLLCFADRSAANDALKSFFRSRPDLLPEYHHHLQRFLQDGLPRFCPTSYAHELAFATVAFSLTAPNETQL